MSRSSERLGSQGKGRDRRGPRHQENTMIQRMDNVLIVVEDLEAAKAFFVELGMELKGRRPSRGLGWTKPSGSTTSVPTSP
jgi:hypothetical protein